VMQHFIEKLQVGSHVADPDKESPGEISPSTP
jgi:hypothetical protein